MRIFSKKIIFLFVSVLLVSTILAGTSRFGNGLTAPMGSSGSPQSNGSSAFSRPSGSESPDSSDFPLASTVDGTSSREEVGGPEDSSALHNGSSDRPSGGPSSSVGSGIGTSSRPSAESGSNSKPSNGSSSGAGSSSVSKPGTSGGTAPIIPTGKYMVGYYPSWASGSGLPPQNVDASLLTHIHYAFANVNANGSLILPHGAIDRNNLQGLVALRGKNPQLKVLLSVGGWDYSYHFSSVAANAATRTTFAKSAADMVKQYNLDGIDIDWEFPKQQDKRNFTLLLQAVRAELDDLSRTTGRTYLLSIAAGTGLTNMEVSAVASVLDYIFLMGYDMHGPWDSYADLNAPLYPAGDVSPQYSISVSGTVASYRSAGVPAKKIVLGMPFYGYRYTTDGSRNDGLYAPFSAGKSISYKQLAASYLSNPSFKRFLHPRARVPYLFDGTTFITYEDAASIAEKVTYARAQGLGGVGAWELSQDLNFTLLRSAHRALHS